MAVLAAVCAAVSVLAAQPAGAHPAGPPPQAHLSADGAEATVELSIEPDDAAVIAAELGLVADEVPDAYIDGDPDGRLGERQRRQVSGHPAVAGYLLEHVRVRQDGTPCEGRVTELDDLFEAGARLAYTCPAEISKIELEVTILLHRDESYRTFGLGVDAEPDLTVFTTATPSHTFDFTASPQAPAADGRRWSGSLPWMGLLLPAGVGAALWRRRGRP